MGLSALGEPAAALKMCPPRYQDIPPEDVPEVTTSDGRRVRVIAGEVAGVWGAVTGIVTDPLYLDVTVPRQSRFVQDVPSSHNAFCYVFEGEATFGIGEADLGRFATPGYLLVLGDGDGATVATADSNVASSCSRKAAWRAGRQIRSVRDEHAGAAHADTSRSPRRHVPRLRCRARRAS